MICYVKNFTLLCIGTAKERFQALEKTTDDKKSLKMRASSLQINGADSLIMCVVMLSCI